VTFGEAAQESRPGGPDQRVGTAVVIGGGYAGLITARVLADFFAAVIVVEQDAVDEDTGVHPHVPQGYHAHAVLAKGAEVLERFFPGLRAELLEAGAPVYDYGERISFLLPTGYAPRARTGVQIQSVTRDELERRLRRRVLALPGVSLRPGTRCVGLSAHAGRVTGVSLRPPEREPGAEPLELAADLVVDASGRSSALADWLGRLGMRVPAKRVVKAKITYTSVGFNRPEPDRPDFDVAYQMTFAPSVPRGGVLLAVEAERWMCSLFGFDDQVPPTDGDGYLAFARSLANPRLAEQLEHREGSEPVHRYTNMNNEWNQYHRVGEWPERLIALGDAVCVFNPVYGQGLTVAALEADLLRAMLDQRTVNGSGLDELGRTFQRRVARLILPPWTLSSSSDMMWHPGRHPVSARVAHWYNRHLFAVSAREPAVWATFVRVINMLAPPTVLFRPRIVVKVLRQASRGRVRMRPQSTE
jgi:2-polyprenyl-6-methoxyphenol hydroxylase-like FAD-dependent oxidoreductase